ncbi:MAG: hypothetical protein HF314_15195 [Ignavibacteria bacterium]|jgi:uncharacterized heparinase superfamily protein|nr:hypothetical protein [Ignavibacteria bacterium]MCU7504426.1 hypothetical protein [Ignavibacteria bacterium]MCU7517483.1 hypothetical protein [Ignavibacteria bacterium]
MLENIAVISRYYHTLRYLKARQTFGRSYAGLKRKFRLYKAPEIPENLTRKLSLKIPFLKHEPWNSRQELLNREFTFLNIKRKFDGQIDWKSPDMPLLWRFNLHYFNYLHLLEGEEKETLILDWIRSNPNDDSSSAAWHPYPLSLRITNWCKEELSNKEILKSLYYQVSYLYRNLETYHPGNHLLENARALIFGGMFFFGQGEAISWLKKGLSIYESELPVQVLTDGGYFELSTMYHAIMLENFLDVLNLLEERNISLPGLKEVTMKMGDFLYSMTHPDGSISLFNDSAEEIAPSSEMILSYLKCLTGYTPSYKEQFPSSGYFVHRGKSLCLIIDGGAPGPDYLPAHSHADIFSYELSAADEKIITDSGVFEYAEGPMRSYVRSTRAHNTVSVDGLDQAECWGSFRLAKRFHPVDVRFSMQGGKSLFSGSFEGYASLIGDDIRHRRTIETDEEKGIITVKDTLSGHGRHLAESFIHVHPSAKIVMQGDTFIVNGKGYAVKITPLSGTPAVKEGWYCPGFGRKIKRSVITVKKDALPCELGYRIEVLKSNNNPKV